MIGDHIPFSQLTSYYKTHSINDPVQVFTGSTRTFYRKAIKIEDNSEVFELLSKIHLYVHSSYLSNLGSSSPTGKKSLDYVKEDLKISQSIGAKGLVIHVSKAVGRPVPEATVSMYNSIMQVLDYIKEEKIKTKLLLETPAGQGSELLITAEEFIAFCKLVLQKHKPQFGIVVDTCHVFSLGYEPDEYINLILCSGLKIDLVHLNDSKGQKGSKIDRHAKVFTGKIGHEALKRCIHICEKNKINMIYE